MKNNTTFVGVSGFFASGSSAVVDLLKEYQGFYECDAEIRIIKDPYGISQMEDTLLNHWDLINSTAAIEDFLSLCHKCSRNGTGPFSPAGLGYKKTIASDFMEITKKYVDELTDFNYRADYYYSKFKKPYLRYVTDRWRWAIEYLTKGRLKTANRNISPRYFACPTQEQFSEATKKYFEALFRNYIENEGIQHIILDQAISPNNTQVIHRYFRSAKLIIIDRDPRDMYADDIQWGVVYDKDYTTKEAGVRYGKRQMALRSKMIIDADVLYIHFEDLVLDYEKVVSQIEEFLHLTPEMHIMKRKYFNPDRSIKNIGIWKKHNDKCKDAFEAIESIVPHLCRKSD